MRENYKPRRGRTRGPKGQQKECVCVCVCETMPCTRARLCVACKEDRRHSSLALHLSPIPSPAHWPPI